MDITLLQVQNGSFNDLMYFKKEIINYLSNKKFSTKSITLVKTLKIIDREINKRKNDKFCRRPESSFEVSGCSILLEKRKCFKIPDFVNENCINSELLNKKRGLERYVIENPHLMSRIATYICSKDNKPIEIANLYDSSCKNEMEIKFKTNIEFKKDFENSIIPNISKMNKSDLSISYLDSQNFKKEKKFFQKNLESSLNDANFLIEECEYNTNQIKSEKAYSHGSRSTDETSICNFNQFSSENSEITKTIFERNNHEQNYLSEKIEDIQVDLFFG